MSTFTTSRIELTGLPGRVQDYLERVLPAGGVTPAQVRLTQEGTLLRKLDGDPHPFHAVEQIAVGEVAFTWDARVGLSRALPKLHVVDRFEGGAGTFTSKLLGVPVSRWKDDHTSVGHALRYLAELPWAPHAMLNPDLRWRVIDQAIVEIETTVGDTAASIALRFGADGDVVAAFGHRPRREGKKTELRSWMSLYSDYEELGGIRIPTHAEVHWTLPDGPFTYFRGTVTGLELI